MKSRRLPTALDRIEWIPEINPIEARIMAWDTLTYLPDDVLHKADRAAMAESLETRAPFLDHRVVEIAWRLPIGMKIRNSKSKWALRQVLYKYDPSELIERPKTGFALPIGHWLTGPLRDWAEAILVPNRLTNDGYLNTEAVRRRLDEHLTGNRELTASLWSVSMFQSWLNVRK